MRYGLDKRPDRSEAAALAEVHGLDLNSVIQHLDEGEERVANIRAAVEKLPGLETKRKVGRVADLAEQVLQIADRIPVWASRLNLNLHESLSRLLESWQQRMSK